MFDFLRDRGSTAGGESQEKLSAYLDNALTPAERQRLESEMNRDPALRARLEQMRLLKLQMRAMPRRRVPRSFALDPALYGRPKAQPLMQLYPVLRGATALTAFLLIFVVALGAFQGQFAGGEAAPATEISVLSETAAEEAAEVPAQEAAEVPAETDRVAPTAAPEEESAAEMTAQEAITEGMMLEDQPPVGGAAPDGYPAVEAPSTDLAFGTPAPEATIAAVEPALEATPADAAATSVASTELPAGETANTAEADQASAAEAGISGLQWLQIGLGLAFLLLLILWMVARRRVRSY